MSAPPATWPFRTPRATWRGAPASSQTQKCDAATAAAEPAFCASLDAGQADFGQNGAITSDGVTHPRGYAVTLSQPIFEGFQNINAIRQAKATVQASRESLRAAEQNVLLNAVTAYVDVVRDLAVVGLRESNVNVLTEQLRQTKDRFNVGEVTRTDVAQAEARRSDAVTQLYAAQANLKASRATYEQVIGHPPSNLVHPPSIVSLLPSEPRRCHDPRRRGEPQSFSRPSIRRRRRSITSIRFSASCCRR